MKVHLEQEVGRLIHLRQLTVQDKHPLLYLWPIRKQIIISIKTGVLEYFDTMLVLPLNGLINLEVMNLNCSLLEIHHVL
jgi:hypothetical protein